MHQDEIKLKCLEIAKQFSTDIDQLMKNAKDLFDFVFNSTMASGQK